MKKRTKIIIAIVGVLLLIIGIITGGIIYIKSNLNPTDEFINGELCNNDEPCEVVPFVVDEGAYGMTTLKKLQEEHIINDANIVYYWNQILGGYSFYAGYYEIPVKTNDQPTNLAQLLGWLSNPKNAHQDTVMISLDEGDFAKSFARVLAKELRLKDNPTNDVAERTQTILNYWNSESVVRGYMEEYPFLTEDLFNKDYKVLLEGYLFPDTYEFFQVTDCDELTRKLLDRTLEIYENHKDEFDKSKLSIHEIFTLASIVQWESGDEDDSKLVSGVFMNRIENPEYEGNGGRFQSTVTTCYAFDFTKEECESLGDLESYTSQENPYNTYVIEGFPPGPVCCPNEISIDAALNPDQTGKYFYFIADMCNGGARFERTYAEQLRDIDRYLLPCLY